MQERVEQRVRASQRVARLVGTRAGAQAGWRCLRDGFPVWERLVGFPAWEWPDAEWVLGEFQVWPRVLPPVWLRA